jgi:CRP-like cAMP-binding protein
MTAMPAFGNNRQGQIEPFFNRSNINHTSAVIRRRPSNHQSAGAAIHPPLFAGVSAGDYARISAAAHAKKFQRGEMLFLEGETVQQVLLLTSGSAKTTQVGLAGMEVILRVSGPGDALGVESLFTTGKHGRTTQAFRTCCVLAWDAPVFKSLVERYPVLHQNLARIFADHLQELEGRFHEVATEKVASRVARQLVRLYDKIGCMVDGAVEIHLLREDLAQMTGTTLFSVSRLFSNWEACGILRPRREAVVVDDIESLRAISLS